MIQQTTSVLIYLPLKKNSIVITTAKVAFLTQLWRRYNEKK